FTSRCFARRAQHFPGSLVHCVASSDSFFLTHPAAPELYPLSLHDALPISVDDGLAILGCGKIGEILAAGLVASAWRRPDQIIVSARRSERAEELAARHGLHATTSNLEAAREARILVVAVKPQDVEELLAEIAPEVTPGHLILSV